MMKICFTIFGRFIMIGIFACFFIGRFAPVLEAEEKKEKIKYEKVKGALGRMIELGESQKKMQKELNKETDRYKKIKHAFEKEAIKKGVYTSQIVKEYGLPVVIVEANDGKNSKKWIYKPGEKTFFSEDKVTMIFNDYDELTDWQIPSKKNKQ